MTPAGLRLTAGLALSLGAYPALAHHSVAFYANEPLVVEGELVRIEWQNPHVRLHVDGVGPDGTKRIWRMETGSISTLQRDGVTREVFTVGDRLAVAGRPSTRDRGLALLTNVLLPDGREAIMWPDTPPRFADRALTIQVPPATVDAAAENRGIFRVWSVPTPNPARRSLENLPLGT